MNWFKNCDTVEEIKKQYRTLALQWHPDRPGGDTATMQAINAAYHAALKAQDGAFCRTDKDDDQGYTYSYRPEREQAVIDKIDEVIRSGILDQGVECYLIGTWLWMVGDTKPHRKTLGSEGLGFLWHGQKKAWYWREQSRKRWYKSNTSLNDIAARYGAERVVGAGGPREGALSRA